MRIRMIVTALAMALLWLAAAPAWAGSAPCVPDDHTLCLNGDRFAVSARFRTNDSGVTDATGVELTGDSGYFWFFNQANIEVVIKVLSACGINDHYWVFATGLTNVEVTLVVTDTQSDITKTYVNTLGVPFAPIQDTSAFECP
jgi:hypothetical protein